MTISEKWNERYKKEERIDLKNYLDKEDFEILKKLNIDVKEKIYTEYEFDLLKLELNRYDEANSNDFTLYGNYTEEETREKFLDIINSENLSEREIILINMYFIACRKERIETYRKNPEDKGVSRQEISYILQKLNHIKEIYNL